MKILLIMGGLLGFGIGALFSWAEQCSGPASLWHACLTAYLTAILMRWWGNAWRKNLEESLRHRQAVSERMSLSALAKPAKT